MKTAIETLLAVANFGGSLALAERDKLRVLLPADCPPELKNAIRTNKAGLLALLAGPPFVVVRSELLPTELVFWTANDGGRDLLIAHGAAPGLVYTCDELAALVERNTDRATLVTLHRAKCLFNGRLFAQ